MTCGILAGARRRRVVKKLRNPPRRFRPGKGDSAVLFPRIRKAPGTRRNKKKWKWIRYFNFQKLEPGKKNPFFFWRDPAVYVQSFSFLCLSLIIVTALLCTLFDFSYSFSLHEHRALPRPDLHLPHVIGMRCFNFPAFSWTVSNISQTGIPCCRVALSLGHRRRRTLRSLPLRREVNR